MSAASLPAAMPAPQRQDWNEVVPLPADPFGAPARGGLHLSDVVLTLWLHRRKLLIAFLVPVLLGLIAALLAPRRYTAESVLLVLATRETSGVQDLTGFLPNTMTVEILKATRSEVEILRSDEVLRRALQQAGPSTIFPDLSATSGPEMDRAVEALRQAIRAEPDPTSNVLRITLTLPDRARALHALEAVMTAYFARRIQVFSDDSTQLLFAETDGYNRQIRLLDEQIRQIQNEYSVLDITQDIQLVARRRDDLFQRESRVREQQVTARAQLQTAQAALAAEPNRVVASVEATNLTPSDDSRNDLGRLLQERERVAAQYVAPNPMLRDLDERIAAARGVLRENARRTFSTTREVRNPGVELLNQRVLTLTVEVGSLNRQLEELTRQRQETEQQGNGLLTAERRLRELTRQRDALEAITRQLATRGAGARIGEEARRQGRPGIQLVQPPTAPANGRSGRVLLLAAGIVAGVVFSGCLGLLLTMTRREYATPEEAERGLSLPAVASLGPLEPATEKMASIPEVEDLVALIRDAEVNGRRLRLVNLVGTSEEDGRAELGRTLAVALARRSVGDIALLDLQSDGRTHLAALGAQPMEVERIPGHLMMFNTVLLNLWISHDALSSDLTSPKASREATASVLDQLRSAFEVVVIIGPDNIGNYPMRRMAAMVDANMIVVRGEKTRGDRARAIRDWVLGSGGALLGFAFTGHRQILPPRLARLV
jgi:uncharacterized protein involved in exopolysaccharide biosynthesis